MVEIQSNTKSFELTGEEVHIHFTAGFPYFWLRNDGSDTVQMSLSPNISEGKDGVISVLAGSSAGTMHGFNSTRQDMYISGSGKVQVMATHTPENPFRNARKGGGENGKSEKLILFSGTEDSCSFSNGLTGFEKIGNTDTSLFYGAGQSAIFGLNLSSQSYVIEKVGGMHWSGEYLDSGLVRSLEKIDLTNYNTILADFAYATNYDSGMIENLGGAYFKIDEPKTYPQQNAAYDWSEWDNMLAYNYSFGRYYMDISEITGEHYLCFGVHHGTYFVANNNALAIQKIMLN